ncbi:uncharacterized protein LOC108601476 [Drosophila busckii]|nr:uncharacterized protein LOC108601476 [Drosophila busckii]
MLLQLSSLLLVGVALGASNYPAELPRCHHGDTTCIINVSHMLVRQYARTGFAPAAFPQVEPFLVKRFDISDGRTGSLSLKLNFRDVNVEGLSSVKFDRAVGFNANPATSKFEMYGSFPKIALRGKYNADGRILILPIRGDGDADITLHNPKFSVKFKPGTQVRNGRTYLSVDKLKVLVEPQKMNIKLTNLFNGDQALGTNLNQFLNENWSEVWTELQPSVHVAIAEIMKSILSTLFKRFAYEDLFLEDSDDPKPCKYGDSECLLKTINYFVSEKHKEGDRSINLVKLDPLPVAKMNINQGADSPVNIDLTFTNNNLLGIGDITFIGVKGFGKNIDKKHELKFKVPRLSLVGPYDIKGKVLILPISGSGKSNMTMVNAELTFSFTGKSVEKNGEMYMEATNVNLLTKPERCYYQFSNLFNGDKALGDNMNAFLNDNWEAIFKEYIIMCIRVGTLLILLGVLYASCNVRALQFPTDIQKCKLSDEKCLKDSVNYVLHTYGATGVKPLGLVPLDPLHIKKFGLGKKPNSPVSIDLQFKDALLIGLKDAMVKKVTHFTKDLKNPVTIDLIAPKLILKGPYSVEGKVLILPIVGNGMAEMILEHCKIHVVVKMKAGTNAEGQTMAEVQDVIMQVDPQKVHYSMENLFNGQKDLSDNLHALINDNWKDIFNELKDDIGGGMGKIFKALLNRAFSKLPLEEVFTDAS